MRREEGTCQGLFGDRRRDKQDFGRRCIGLERGETLWNGIDGTGTAASYTEEQIDANTSAGVLRVKGRRLTLLAMTAGELRIGGEIWSVEWVAPC